MTSNPPASANREQSRPTAADGRHHPVLLDEAVGALQPHPGGTWVDGTFGGGGHTTRILERSDPDGRVIAFDRDPAAIERGQALRTARGWGDRLILVHANFDTMPDALARLEIGPVDGVLLDLGFSSFQVDDPQRGFSFLADGPLDMRMDPTTGQPASDLVNHLDERALADLVWRYGDESRSRRIAAAIVRARTTAPIETTGQLAALVEGAVGGRRGAPTHPATRTFQALRIATNDELAALELTLASLPPILRPGGRLAVIAFHSLEDRIVKTWIARQSARCICPPEQPVCTCHHQPTMRPVGKPIRPAEAEVRSNSRARSAILRVAERLAPAETRP